MGSHKLSAQVQPTPDETQKQDVIVASSTIISGMCSSQHLANMFSEILVGLGLTSLLRTPSTDGLPLSTVALLLLIAFWSGFVLGAGITLFCVSPSLRRFARHIVLSVLSDEGGARARLARYRRD